MAWHVAMKPGKRKVLDKTTTIGGFEEQLEKDKASVRTKVEHPFRVFKRQFGHVNVHFRRLARNAAQVMTDHLLELGSAPSTGAPSFSAERSKTRERPKTSWTHVG
jgi:hypothetical protein